MSDDASVCVKCGAPRDGADDERTRCQFCGARYDAPTARREPNDADNARAASGRGAATGAFAFVFVAAFGVLWTIAAASMGAPFPFPLFGLLFSGFTLYVGFAARRSRAEGGTRTRDDD